MGYYGIDDRYYTMLYAGLGLVCVIVGRVLGLRQIPLYRANNEQTMVIRGRGLSAFQSGNGILCVACLAAFMQGLAGVASMTGGWLDVGSLGITTATAALATVIVPASRWRRVYTTAAVALGAVAFLRLNLLIELDSWQKLEIFCVAVGLGMLVASHLGMFREGDGKRSEEVGFGLALGSILATLPLVIGFLYHRSTGGEPSLYDEMALITVTILMLVTGLSWQIKATTVSGAAALVLYLCVLIVSLAYQPQVAIGIYMAVGGAVVFALGIGFSIYREQLLDLPERVTQRKGVFRVLNWR